MADKKNPVYQQLQFFKDSSLDKAETAARREIVAQGYPAGPVETKAAGGGVFAFLGRERTDPASGTTELTPTGPANRNVVSTLTATSMPRQDLRDAAGLISSSNSKAWVSGLSRDALGNYELPVDLVRYGTDLKPDNRRLTVVHELAHRLQNRSLGESRALEEDKVLRQAPERVEGASKFFPLGPTGRVLEPGLSEKAAKRYRRPRVLGDMERPSVYSDAFDPVIEGSAEGYRYRYAEHPTGRSAYDRPNFFAKPKYGSQGQATADIARQYTRETGEVITYADLREPARLVGSLASDVRTPEADAETISRMALNKVARMAAGKIDLPTTSIHTPAGGQPWFEGERRLRQKALEGEIVQGSFFPDIVPEVDQFGDKPIGEEELDRLRSDRARIILSGRESEIEPKSSQAYRLEARRQRAVEKDRYRNVPIPNRPRKLDSFDVRVIFGDEEGTPEPTPLQLRDAAMKRGEYPGFFQLGTVRGRETSEYITNPLVSRHRSRIKGYLRKKDLERRKQEVEEALAAEEAAKRQKSRPASRPQPTSTATPTPTPTSGSRTLHPKVEEHLGKFVYKPKGDYARKYAEWLAFGGDEPSASDFGLREEIAEKARQTVSRTHQKHHGR